MATFKAVIDLTWNAPGSPGVNVFHFRADENDPVTASPNDVMQRLESFYDGVKALLASGVVASCDGTIIKDPYGSPEFYDVDPWTVSGTGVGGYAPLASALCVGWKTASATRSGRGRTFLGPLAGDIIDADGTPTPSAMTIARNEASFLVDTSKGWTQAALGVYSPTDGVLRDFQASAVQDQFAVLRSRRD